MQDKEPAGKRNRDQRKRAHPTLQHTCCGLIWPHRSERGRTMAWPATTNSQHHSWSNSQHHSWRANSALHLERDHSLITAPLFLFTPSSGAQDQAAARRRLNLERDARWPGMVVARGVSIFSEPRLPSSSRTSVPVTRPPPTFSTPRFCSPAGARIGVATWRRCDARRAFGGKRPIRPPASARQTLSRARRAPAHRCGRWGGGADMSVGRALPGGDAGYIF
eukprot:scaffold4195_cov92-Isochrysis_galbana.AAC.4